jgi:putative phosphoribosyl transferase
MAAYHDRRAAGAVLAARLGAYAGRPDVVVLGLPRGGVPVASEVARELRAPLDVFLVRKLGVPGHEELAMGAIASGDVEVINRDVVERLEIPLHVVAAVATRELHELARREATYRAGRRAPDLHGKAVILVDDGLATGSTMRAAVEAVRAQRPARIVVAVPVAAPATVEALAPEVDEVICPLQPESFYAVGLWYDNFDPVSDEQVRDLLRRASPISGSDPDPSSTECQTPPVHHDPPPPAGDLGTPPTTP